MRVAVVGGGIAGLTAALRLAQRGYDVTIYEEQKVLGGNLSSRKINGVYHDVYPHMFCDWYANFWEIFESDLGLDRATHFEPRAGVKLLLEGNGEYLELKNATSMRAVWHNLLSGVMPMPDMFLLGFSMLDVASQPFNQRELLNRLSVNGFLYSRPYATERLATLHDLVLMEIWSIHGDLTSATSYKHFIKHIFGFPRAEPFAWMLKGSLQEKLIAPLERKLRSLRCKIRMGHKVEHVRVADDTIGIELAGAKGQHVDAVVLAVPAEALARLIVCGEEGTRIVDRAPQLSELRRLRAEPIAVVDLYFKRKLPGIPAQHVALSGSDGNLTFLDISQLWTDDPNLRDRTALILAASDFYALPSAKPEDDAHLMIRRLHEYLPVFDPGAYWGDPKSDVCWKSSLFQTNLSRKVFVNEVGSDQWRPRTSYASLPNVFFAGDCCRTEVDMATIEAAVLSGLHAAQAVQQRAPSGAPITVTESTPHADVTLLALRLALTPYAYGAKWWSAALDVLPTLGRRDLPQALSTAAGMLLLPYTYALDWWETAFAFWKTVLFDRKPSPKPSE